MRLIALHLLNDLGSDSIGGSIADQPFAWPGLPVDYDVTIPPENVAPVWAGVSADGSTNQIFPMTATVAQIIAAGFPRVYQVTQITGADGSVQVFSENLKTVQILIAACCLNTGQGSPSSPDDASASPGESTSPSPGAEIFGEEFGPQFG